MIQSYKDLLVWQRAIELVKEIYKITLQIPDIEKYGLIVQMRRAAISIPSNIAEGYKRRCTGDYIRFLTIADGSAAELETQIIIAKDVYSNINFSQSKNLLTEIQKMLITLIKKLKEYK